MGDMDKQLLLNMDGDQHTVLHWRSIIERRPMSVIVREAVDLKIGWDDPKVRQQARLFFDNNAESFKQLGDQTEAADG
jgi:hypothetical protein